MSFAAVMSTVASVLVLISSVASAETHQDLAELVALALERNPQLDVLAAQIEALEYKATQAGAWKDPLLTVAYQNVPVDSWALGDEAMSMLRMQLGQTIPFPGKTQKRKGVVLEAKKAKQWEHQEKKNQLRGAVKQAYYKLALSRQLKTLTLKHVGLVEQLLDAVRIKYEVGRAPQQNLLRLEVLRERLKDELHEFGRRELELTAALNAALHRSGAAPISTPATLDFNVLSSDITALRNLAIAHRPLLKQMTSSAHMHRAAAELARFEAMPDPTFFAAYGVRAQLPNGNAGRNLMTLGLSVPLPVFYESRYDARAQEATVLARAAMSQRDAWLDTLSSKLADAVATWTRAVEKVTTYREILVPGAHRMLDATFSSYQVDRADFLSLFETQLELLNFEKTIRMATVDALLAEAAIEMLTGKEL